MSNFRSFDTSLVSIFGQTVHPRKIQEDQVTLFLNFSRVAVVTFFFLQSTVTGIIAHSSSKHCPPSMAPSRPIARPVVR